MSAQQDANSTVPRDSHTAAKDRVVNGKSTASPQTKKKAGVTVNKRLDGANAMPFPSSSKRTRVEAPGKSKNIHESADATNGADG